MQEEIKLIREILERLEVAQTKQGVNIETKLEDGYCANSFGEIDKLNGCTDGFLRKLHAQGNWFPTKEAAEKEAKRRAVVQKMRGFTKGFVPDWTDQNQTKCSVIYLHPNGAFHNEDWGEYQGSALFGIYFGTPEDRQSCIDAMDDEIKAVL